MTNTEFLVAETAPQRDAFRRIDLIGRALAGDVTRELYADFLAQAYYHVRHTVPLLMAVGARLPDRLRWLQEPVVRYIEEEAGHDEWILGDLEALGLDAAAIRAGTPSVQTEAMVAYAYDFIARRSAIGFFGMVHVLEGTSSALALAAADSIQRSLGLPDRAMTYLRTHGHLDQQHVGDFASIVDRLDRAQDLPPIVECARSVYWHYGNIFRSLGQAPAGVEPARRCA